MKLTRLPLAIGLLLFATVTPPAAQAAVTGDAHEPVPLFNGENLDGWEQFTSNKLDTALTWRVAGGVIRCTGEPAGYIMTEDEYEDFHLTFEWRWADEPGNSGVLLRTVGEDKIWPSCLEAQLMHDRAGDFWKIGQIDAETAPDRTNGNNTRALVNPENPVGEWNRYDIFAVGEHVTLVINGQFVNAASGVSERAGRIALQSEGAPIEFRNIRLTNLAELDESPDAASSPAANAYAGLMHYKMTTSMGEIVLELDADKAPITVANFDEYVTNGHYDGTIFHRVIDNFMIQGGGFNPDMSQKPTGDQIKNEWENGLSNEKYTIAMARLGNQPDSATAQFFINVGDNAFLDQPRDGAGYAVFGRVIEGQDVVEAIRAVPTATARGHGDVPVEPVVIEKIERIDD